MRTSNAWRCCRAGLRHRRGRVYREAVGNRRSSRAHFRDGQPWVLCVAALLDGVHFVVGLGTGHDDHEVRLYHVDGTLVHTFEGHNAEALFHVTLDGQHIISGSVNLVKVWSVATKSLVSTCGHTDGVVAVAAMPDGQRILSGSMDNTVRVWLLDGALKNAFELHTDTVILVALPDNQHALSASRDKTVKLFNVNDGAVAHLRHHTDPVMCLALYPTAADSSAPRKTRPPASSSTDLRRRLNEIPDTPTETSETAPRPCSARRRATACSRARGAERDEAELDERSRGAARRRRPRRRTRRRRRAAGGSRRIPRRPAA